MIFKKIMIFGPWLSGHSVYRTYVKVVVFFIPISILYLICKRISPTTYVLIKKDCFVNTRNWGYPSQEFSFWLFCVLVATTPTLRFLIAYRIRMALPFKILMFPSRKIQIKTKPENIGGGLMIVHGWNTQVGAQSIGENCLIHQDVSIISSRGGYPIVGNEVRIYAGATIYGSVKIGNGAILSACSVVSSNVPPYSIVVGNPGKVVGFTKTPEEIIKYETVHYSETERMSLKEAEHNYYKYYLSRLDEITKILSL